MEENAHHVESGPGVLDDREEVGSLFQLMEDESFLVELDPGVEKYQEDVGEYCQPKGEKDHHVE